jgi:hypothetical protein
MRVSDTRASNTPASHMRRLDRNRAGWSDAGDAGSVNETGDARDVRVRDRAPLAPFERLLVLHRGPVIERDLLDYAAWVAATCGASAHLLVVPDAGVLHNFAPAARSIFACRGVEGVSMTAMVDRHIDELFDAVRTHGADLILTRPFSSRRSGRRAALRLWNDAPCSVWTVPCGSPPSVTRAFADISDETGGPLLLERAARLCRRTAAHDLIVFRACFRDMRTTEEDLQARFLHQQLLALYRTLHDIPLHGMPCTPLVDELPSVHRALLTKAYAHAADLVIVDPASTPAFRWSDARRDIATFLATCDLPLLQLRGEKERRHEAALRPWQGLSGREITGDDVWEGTPPHAAEGGGSRRN